MHSDESGHGNGHSNGNAHGKVHEHGHDHAAPSEHGTPHEAYSARPHPEYVVLDLGGEVGALIVYTDQEMHGVEVEISQEGDDDTRTHKDVLERTMGTTPAFTAVFDNLTAGRYTLWVGDEARARGVQVTGGVVAELDWRDALVPR